MLCVPAVRAVVVKDACPDPSTGLEPMTRPPSLKSTVPVGVSESKSTTEAVKVTLPPNIDGAAPAVRATFVQVLIGQTTCK